MNLWQLLTVLEFNRMTGEQNKMSKASKRRGGGTKQSKEKSPKLMDAALKKKSNGNSAVEENSQLATVNPPKTRTRERKRKLGKQVMDEHPVPPTPPKKKGRSRTAKRSMSIEA